MDDVHGKEIPLQYVTVKVPGQKPRGSRSIITSSNGSNSINDGLGGLSLTGNQFLICQLLFLIFSFRFQGQTYDRQVVPLSIREPERRWLQVLPGQRRRVRSQRCPVPKWGEP